MVRSRARVWVAGIFPCYGVPVVHGSPNRFACSCLSRSQPCTRSGPRPRGSHVPVSDFVSRLGPAAAPSSLTLVLVDVSWSLAGDHVLVRPGLDSAATGLGSIFYAGSCPVIHCLFFCAEVLPLRSKSKFLFSFFCCSFLFPLRSLLLC
jgi:hypothetical protein